MKGFRQWKCHLDEVYVKINGEMVYLWRAVGQEGDVLERNVTKKREKHATCGLLKCHGSPETSLPTGCAPTRRR